MTPVKRVVDARRNQGRLLYHLQCGHTVSVPNPILVRDSLGIEMRELTVGDEVDCNIDNCSTADIRQPPPDPRYADHWSRVYASVVQKHDATLAIEEADRALLEYKKRFK